MTAFLIWTQVALTPVSPTFWSHVYEIVAVALLLLVQSFWQRRSGSKSFDSKLAELGNNLRTAINANRDTATAEFAEVQRHLDGLGHRIELWAEKTNSIGKSVDGLLSREQTRLEDDAQVTRRRRRT